MNRTIAYIVIGTLAVLTLAGTASAATLVFPKGGEYLNGIETITWTRQSPSSDIELRLFVSGSEIRPELCDPCPGTTFSLDTGKYGDSREYFLEIRENGDGINGNPRVTTSGTFTIDNKVPDTAADLSGPVGLAGWFTGDVTVSLDAQDETSGVAATTAAVDGGASGPYQDAFRVAGDGAHSVVFASTDRATNAEASRGVSFNIDGTAPASAISIGSPSVDDGRVVWVTSATPITLSAADATSGVAGIGYRLNREDFQAYTGPFVIAGADGAYLVEWRAVDVAGNVEALQHLTVVLDNTAPGLDLDRPQAGGLYADGVLVAETHPLRVETAGPAAGNGATDADTIAFAVATGTLDVRVSADDGAGVGVAVVRFYVDGVLRAEDASAPYAWTWDTSAERLGEHVLTVEAEDLLGNADTRERRVLTIPAAQEGVQKTLDAAIAGQPPVLPREVRDLLAQLPAAPVAASTRTALA